LPHPPPGRIAPSCIYRYHIPWRAATLFCAYRHSAGWPATLARSAPRAPHQVPGRVVQAVGSVVH